MNKTEIIAASENSFHAFSETCRSIDPALMFYKPGAKWSVAENIRHMVISTNMTTLAYRIPLFLVRWISGTPNRPSRTYEELKARYYKKLDEGGRASARFVPKPIEVSYGRQKLISSWDTSTKKYVAALKKNRKEEDLDNYLARHPLLGRITLRELCYFSIFHTEHHLKTIRTLIQQP